MLAAWMRHASRMGLVPWQTREEHVGLYPKVRDNPPKGGIILDSLFGGKIYRFGNGLRAISLLVRERLTKATTARGGERLTPTDGTATRSLLLREAAVENLPQWTKV